MQTDRFKLVHFFVPIILQEPGGFLENVLIEAECTFCSLDSDGSLNIFSMPIRVGARGSGHILDHFHSGGHNTPWRHLELVYSSTSSERKRRAQLLGIHLLAFYSSFPPRPWGCTSTHPAPSISKRRTLNFHSWLDEAENTFTTRLLYRDQKVRNKSS